MSITVCQPARLRFGAAPQVKTPVLTTTNFGRDYSSSLSSEKDCLRTTRTSCCAGNECDLALNSSHFLSPVSCLCLVAVPAC